MPSSSHLFAAIAVCSVIGTSCVWADSTSADLDAAIRADDVSALQEALDDGANPDTTNGTTPLILATVRGNADMVAALLEAGADPDLQDARGYTALTVAAVDGDLAIVELLLSKGADLDIREQSPGRTIVQLVIDQNSTPPIDVLTALLDAGADMDAKDDRGESALASAAFMGRLEVADLLIARGADVDIQNNDGITPAEWARRQGHNAIAAMLTDEETQ